MSNSDEKRVDKVLWSVRIFKTRSQASEACKKGRVTLNTISTKPSKLVSIGDIIEVKKMPVLYTYKILSIPPSRIGPKLVQDYIEDLTSPEELSKLDARPDYNSGKRERGLGRPTKRERREIDRFSNSDN